jgi:hypothetical protein
MLSYSNFNLLDLRLAVATYGSSSSTFLPTSRSSDFFLITLNHVASRYSCPSDRSLRLIYRARYRTVNYSDFNM